MKRMNQFIFNKVLKQAEFSTLNNCMELIGEHVEAKTGKCYRFSTYTDEVFDGDIEKGFTNWKVRIEDFGNYSLDGTWTQLEPTTLQKSVLIDLTRATLEQWVEERAEAIEEETERMKNAPDDREHGIYGYGY